MLNPARAARPRSASSRSASVVTAVAGPLVLGGHAQPCQLPHLLACDAERFPAGGQDAQAGAVREQFGRDRGRLGDHVLAVVQHDQRAGAAQVVGQVATSGSSARERTSLVRPAARLVRQGAAGQRVRDPVEHRTADGGGGQLDDVHAVRMVRGGVPGQFQGQPGLAGPARSGEREHPGAAQLRGEPFHLTAPADEPAGGRRYLGRRVQRRVAPVDRPGQRDDLGPGFEAELGVQFHAQPLVGGLRVADPPAAVEREQVQPGEPLANRMPHHELGQFRDDLGVPADAEFGLEPVLHHREPQFGQAQPGRCHVRSGRSVGEGFAAPQRQCRAEIGDRAGRSFGEQRADRVDDGHEPARVQFVLGGVELVARVGGDQPVADHLADGRHVHLQAGHGGRRWLRTPDLVDEVCGRHRCADMHDQGAEHRARPRSAQPGRLPATRTSKVPKTRNSTRPAPAPPAAAA